eukprot:TRINITY_DN1164_c0_g1_i1.p1 TRINITY_DN1164_c0_g1~~TRINITY_DN1164_c0_g1_i1.p1  ORF type:complete len:185 (+),score=34.43 TRINITY_DN1164_c0_g1_i1:55-609(+)
MAPMFALAMSSSLVFLGTLLQLGDAHVVADAMDAALELDAECEDPSSDGACSLTALQLQANKANIPSAAAAAAAKAAAVSNVSVESVITNLARGLHCCGSCPGYPYCNPFNGHCHHHTYGDHYHTCDVGGSTPPSPPPGQQAGQTCSKEMKVAMMKLCVENRCSFSLPTCSCSCAEVHLPSSWR